MRQELEIGLLLGLLRGDGGFQPEPGSFNVDRLIRLAEIHKVVYQLMMFARQHPDLFTGGQIEYLDNHCRQAAMRSLKQLHELKQIVKQFRGKRIPFAVIKGPQLARMLYGRETLKESVDIDIMLVNQGDLTIAHEVLNGLGYTLTTLKNLKTAFGRRIFLIAKREVQYISPVSQCIIDLHVRPGANTYLTAGYFRGFFTGLSEVDLEGTMIPVLSREKYLVYLCYHGSLHQFSRLAWLLDIRAFLKMKQDELDYNEILTIARSLHTERGVFLALRLLEEYFGDKVSGPLKDMVPRSKRMNFLAAWCRTMIQCDERYGMSWPGRMGKLVYMMVLIRGFAGKVDWVYSIGMRFLAGRLKGG